MLTSLQLIDLAKDRLALAHSLTLPMTDYRLAKLLGIRQATVSSWRTGRTGIGVEFAQKFADACELPPAYVMACIEHERASDESVKHIFEVIAEAFTSHAAAVILSVALGASALISGNIPAADSGQNLYLH